MQWGFASELQKYLWAKKLHPTFHQPQGKSKWLNFHSGQTFPFKIVTFYTWIALPIWTLIETLTGPFNKSVSTYASLIMQNGSCCGIFYETAANFTYLKKKKSNHLIQFIALWKPSVLLSWRAALTWWTGVDLTSAVLIGRVTQKSLTPFFSTFLKFRWISGWGL